MSLSDEIMNLTKAYDEGDEYGEGFNDGLIDSARLALKADAEIERRGEAISSIKTAIIGCFKDNSVAVDGFLHVSIAKYNDLVAAVNQATTPPALT